MNRITIAALPPDDAEPYAHLEPIVDALLAAGNEIAGPSKFYRDRDGWRADLGRSIDFALVEERFELPPAIRLNRPGDSIFCRNTWIEIKGEVTEWTRPALSPHSRSV